MSKPRTSNDAMSFRDYLPDCSSQRFVSMQAQTPYEYANAFKENGQPPWLHALYMYWRQLLQEPFKGVTNDGQIRPGLFQLEDQVIPIDDIVAAAKLAISKMDQKQRERSHHHIDSPEWRTWSNPEFLLSDKGIRLDEVSQDLRAAVMGVLEAALSPEGYEKAVGAMRVNGFLGEIVNTPAIMNEFSYNFVIFGQEPSKTQPWGFAIYGHHLCLNAFFYKSQMVLSPWFTGAEPNVIDEGPYKGTRILQTEETLGLRLMQSLSMSSNLQSKAQVYREMKDPAMPHGRWNHDDQRHLCGAYRDNRVVPYEGILVSEMNTEQQDCILQIVHQYLLYLPAKAQEMRLAELKSWFHETYFCWIGGFEDKDPFYYRIQSPVIIAEFDHHSGVFLSNKEPAKFHIHTLLRTPNGGDYGMALRPLIPGTRQEFQWEEKN